jgi:hypothetical protein
VVQRQSSLKPLLMLFQPISRSYNWSEHVPV